MTSRYQTLLNVKEYVSNLYANAEKTGSKGYTLDTINKKRLSLLDSEDTILSVKFDTNADDSAYVEKCQILIRSIRDIIANSRALLNKLEEKLNPTEVQRASPVQESTLLTRTDLLYEMANFNFETALKLPVLGEDTSRNAIRDFLDIAQSYHDILSLEGQKQLIQFLALNKVQGKSKTRLGDVSALVTFGHLKTALLSKCGVVETFESLTTNLRTRYQGRRTLAEYSEELELLAAKLANLSIERDNIIESSARNAVGKVYRDIALTTFKGGIHQELKSVVEAARPATLADALAVATSALANGAQAKQVYSMQHRGHYRGHSYRGQNRSNYSTTYRGQRGQFRGSYRGQNIQNNNNYRENNYRGNNNRGYNNNNRFHNNQGPSNHYRGKQNGQNNRFYNPSGYQPRGHNVARQQQQYFQFSNESEPQSSKNEM